MHIYREELTTTPWRVRESRSCQGKWALVDANDEYIATFESKEVAEMCAGCQNAFDGDPGAILWWEANRKKPGDANPASANGSRWWKNKGEVLALAQEFADAGWLMEGQLFEFLSKPWLWTAEYRYFKKRGTICGFPYKNKLGDHNEPHSPAS